jgi:aminopeptidase-like protein
MAAARVTPATVPFAETVKGFDANAAGARARGVVESLYPICRSITGDGVRESLGLLQNVVPLTVHEVPTGTQVFDWTVPKEWNVRDAYIKNAAGERIVDFRQHNLHVVNYSIPVHRTIPLAELKPHLTALPDHPDWIPYRTSYYRETWGFCLTQRQLDAMIDGEYEVCIDSTLEAGHLSYGEYLVAGETDREVLFSCHSCHPSLCNDNLSGMAVAAELARALSEAAPLRYSYRFLWIPGTIGAITWLALNEPRLPAIEHGLVLSCVGDAGPFTYKRSRRGDAEIDRAVEHVLRMSGREFQLRDFIPYGYDERQYCSPGINLPVGCFMRTPNGEYAEYHSSADNLSIVTADALADSARQLMNVVQVLEENDRWINQSPKCEPQLGRRGLYRSVGGLKDARANELAMLWVLNYSDGQHDLLEIARRSGLPFVDISAAARVLRQARLLGNVSPVRP